MPKSSDNEPPPYRAPRPLPPPYNAPRQTPQPYIPPRPVQPPRSTTPARAYPAGAERGTGATAAPPEPPRRSPNRREQVVFALIALAIAVVAISFVIYNAGRAERDDDGNIAEAGTVYTNELEVGDCLDTFDATTNIADVPAVPCSQPHGGEIVGTFELPDGPYPEEQDIFRIADVRCAEVLHSYAPRAYDDPLVGVTYLYPTRLTWDEHDDHEVICIATSVTGPAAGRLTER